VLEPKREAREARLEKKFERLDRARSGSEEIDPPTWSREVSQSVC
jgi:hypothetical protein